VGGGRGGGGGEQASSLFVRVICLLGGFVVPGNSN